MMSFGLLLSIFCSAASGPNTDTAIAASNQKVRRVNEKPLTQMSAQAKSLRLITGHTAATLPKGTLEIAIQHRFGELNSGAYNLFGLDNFNSMRIGVDVGITDRLTAGGGRSSNRKTYNAYAKYRIIGLPEGKFNITYVADMALDARLRSDWNEESLQNIHRIFYTHQLVASWQITDNWVVAILPTIVHANLVSQTSISNDMPILAWYVRKQVIPKMALTAEGSSRLQSLNTVAPKTNPTLGFGFEYFTPRHVFQINVTNSRALNEAYFLTDNPKSTRMGEFCLGFNLIRRW